MSEINPKKDELQERKNVDLPKKMSVDEFTEAYQELCDTYGFRVYATPAWVVRDDNTFSLVVNYTIGKMR